MLQAARGKVVWEHKVASQTDTNPIVERMVWAERIRQEVVSTYKREPPKLAGVGLRHSKRERVKYRAEAKLDRVKARVQLAKHSSDA